MSAMRALQHLVVLFGFALSLSAAGCSDVNQQVSCSDDSSCVMLAGNLVPTDDGGTAGPARCCGGICVLPSLGCDSGYRYLTSAPAYGKCVAMSSCSEQPRDLSMSQSPADMAKGSTD
jgi:hypothetical protein